MLIWHWSSTLKWDSHLRVEDYRKFNHEGHFRLEHIFFNAIFLAKCWLFCAPRLEALRIWIGDMTRIAHQPKLFEKETQSLSPPVFIDEHMVGRLFRVIHSCCNCGIYYSLEKERQSLHSMWVLGGWVGMCGMGGGWGGEGSMKMRSGPVQVLFRGILSSNTCRCFGGSAFSWSPNGSFGLRPALNTGGGAKGNRGTGQDEDPLRQGLLANSGNTIAYPKSLTPRDKRHLKRAQSASGVTVGFRRSADLSNDSLPWPASPVLHPSLSSIHPSGSRASVDALKNLLLLCCVDEVGYVVQCLGIKYVVTS